jgi:hypothetical protein
LEAIRTASGSFEASGRAWMDSVTLSRVVNDPDLA